MATYYVDFDLGTDGNTGTEEDPFSFTDFQTSLSGGPHTYNLRGTHNDNSSSINLYSNDHTIQGWDNNAYGPWRLNCETFNGLVAGLVTIKGGIIGLDVGTTLPGNVINCYIISRDTITVNDSNIIGSSLNTVEFDPANSASVLTDTVIKADDFSYHVSCTFNNCALNGTRAEYTLNNCQTDWSVSSLPAWDDPKESFSIYGIFAGIETPPQPGSSPYTGYETYLWGGVREGIGTGYLPIFKEKETTGDTFIGMPSGKLSSPKGDGLANTNRGNPLGNVVDNTAGQNVQKSILDPKRQSSGHSLGMYSKPSWLSS